MGTAPGIDVSMEDKNSLSLLLVLYKRQLINNSLFLIFFTRICQQIKQARS